MLIKSTVRIRLFNNIVLSLLTTTIFLPVLIVLQSITKQDINPNRLLQ